MMNCKEFGRSSRGLILRFYSGICLDGLRKTRNTCQHSRSEDLNPGLSGYEGIEILKKAYSWEKRGTSVGTQDLTKSVSKGRTKK
jgi:hypothetical protein